MLDCYVLVWSPDSGAGSEFIAREEKVGALVAVLRISQKFLLALKRKEGGGDGHRP